MSLTTPVEVSLCTTSTALIACSRSFRKRVSSLRRIGGGAPVVGQRLDLELEGFAAHAPIEREEAALDDQQLVAWRKQIDESRLPRPMPGCGIGENCLLGLEHAFEAGKASSAMARNWAPVKSIAPRSIARNIRSGMLVGPGLIKKWYPRLTAIPLSGFILL